MQILPSEEGIFEIVATTHEAAENCKNEILALVEEPEVNKTYLYAFSISFKIIIIISDLALRQKYTSAEPHNLEENLISNCFQKYGKRLKLHTHVKVKAI